MDIFLVLHYGKPVDFIKAEDLYHGHEQLTLTYGSDALDEYHLQYLSPERVTGYREQLEREIHDREVMLRSLLEIV